jgi:hypothetical protein
VKIAISGEFLRPGQDGNISWLYSTLWRMLVAKGHSTHFISGRPKSFFEWVALRNEGASEYCDAFGSFDLLIGFELSQAAKKACTKWINIRRHPIRWGYPLWSVESSYPVNKGIPRAKIPPLPFRSQRTGWNWSCFTTQVSSDAALLGREGIIEPGHLLERIKEYTKCFEVLHVVPHPLEKEGPWVSALMSLPNARLWTEGAYRALAVHNTCFTVSSSTGYEAPFFGCLPTFLLPPENFGEPRDISNPNLWECVL